MQKLQRVRALLGYLAGRPEEETYNIRTGSREVDTHPWDCTCRGCRDWGWADI